MDLCTLKYINKKREDPIYSFTKKKLRQGSETLAKRV